MKLKRIIGNFMVSPFHSKGQAALVLFVFSYVLIAINSKWGFWGVVLAPDFFPAFLFTLFMATSFAIYAHELNAKLVLKYGSTARMKLIFYQFCWGVMLPIGLELVSVEFYFYLKDESILTNNFFSIDFILVVTFILLVNAVYSFANKNRKERLQIRERYKHKVIPALKDLSNLRSLHRLALIKNAPVSLNEINLKDLALGSGQIACIYKLNELITIHYFNNSFEHTTTPITKLMEGLDPNEYTKINPYCIYHRLLIFSFKEIAPSRRLYLTLRHPFNHFTHDYQRIVSQGVAVYFKKWMKG
ncbi:hypothetical protein [Pedobacter cryotolerans]|uniref:HTH LytTR-type domain-containing protein n=1 Tax=Pedobacter cryotolerans TaxID=2571270 RepID=A0A4U1CAH9_9SPHI|nr:hypothetical protein [Pedobacter cryotolerans]TKC03479.1 hypothetical protein FA045_02605 [Pedobacter cryotolerans]